MGGSGVKAAPSARPARAQDRADGAHRRTSEPAERVPGSPARAADAHARAETRWGMVAQLAPVALAQADQQGLCTFVNQRWCELTGMRAADALSAPWTAAVHPGDAPRAEQAWAQLAADQGDLELDCQLALADDRQRGVHVTAVGVPAGDGQPTTFLLAMADVSAYREAEARQQRRLAEETKDRKLAERARLQLADQNSHLQELADLKTQFLATVSHELRTPLTSVVAFVELIRGEEEDLGADTMVFLDIIQRNAGRVTRLVGDLLLLSRLEAGAITLELAPVSVPEVVQEAALAASAASAEGAIRLEVNAQDGPMLPADRHRLAQLVDNLITNAVKFTPDGGLVRASAVCDGEYWMIEVADSGIGVPPADLDRLFDRFFRASNVHGAATPGTGLGLSVVKTIAELHGGRVEASSTLGEGTTFRVFLPIRS